MARANAASRNSKNPFQPGLDKLEASSRTVGHADAQPVILAARELAKGIRKVLSVDEGNGWDRDAASRPGQPPRKRQGRLQKSIGTSVVAGVRRVGSGFFTAPLLQYGHVAAARAARAAGTKTDKRGRSRKVRARKATAAHTVEPRPFMEKGLELAKPKMGEVVAQSLQSMGRGIPIPESGGGNG